METHTHHRYNCSTTLCTGASQPGCTHIPDTQGGIQAHYKYPPPPPPDPDLCRWWMAMTLRTRPPNQPVICITSFFFAVLLQTVQSVKFPQAQWSAATDAVKWKWHHSPRCEWTIQLHRVCLDTVNSKVNTRQTVTKKWRKSTPTNGARLCRWWCDYSCIKMTLKWNCMWVFMIVFATLLRICMKSNDAFCSVSASLLADDLCCTSFFFCSKSKSFPSISTQTRLWKG